MKSIDNQSPLQQADSVVGPSEPDLRRLASLVSAYTPYDGSFALRLPGLHAVRFSRTNTELVHAVQRPVLCIIAQVAKTVMLGLQYQKVLRLQEARRLLLSTRMDAGTASRQVGYLSAPQFSRDYRRFFGSPPSKDIARLRDRVLPQPMFLGRPSAKYRKKRCPSVGSTYQ